MTQPSQSESATIQLWQAPGALVPYATQLLPVHLYHTSSSPREYMKFWLSSIIDPYPSAALTPFRMILAYGEPMPRLQTAPEESVMAEAGGTQDLSGETEPPDEQAPPEQDCPEAHAVMLLHSKHESLS